MSYGYDFYYDGNKTTKEEFKRLWDASSDEERRLKFSQVNSSLTVIGEVTTDDGERWKVFKEGPSAEETLRRLNSK